MGQGRASARAHLQRCTCTGPRLSSVQAIVSCRLVQLLALTCVHLCALSSSLALPAWHGCARLGDEWSMDPNSLMGNLGRYPTIDDCLISSFGTERRALPMHLACFCCCCCCAALLSPHALSACLMFVFRILASPVSSGYDSRVCMFPLLGKVLISNEVSLSRKSHEPQQHHSCPCCSSGRMVPWAECSSVSQVPTLRGCALPVAIFICRPPLRRLSTSGWAAPTPSQAPQRSCATRGRPRRSSLSGCRQQRSVWRLRRPCRPRARRLSGSCHSSPPGPALRRWRPPTRCAGLAWRTAAALVLAALRCSPHARLALWCQAGRPSSMLLGTVDWDGRKPVILMSPCTSRCKWPSCGRRAPMVTVKWLPLFTR